MQSNYEIHLLPLYEGLGGSRLPSPAHFGSWADSDFEKEQDFLLTVQNEVKPYYPVLIRVWYICIKEAWITEDFRKNLPLLFFNSYWKV